MASTENGLAKARTGLHTAENWAKRVWTYPSEGNKSFAKYIAVLGKCLEVIDPTNRNEYNMDNDRDFLQLHTGLIWMYSQWEAEEAAILYKTFVDIVYQYYYQIITAKGANPETDAILNEKKRKLMVDVVDATDSNKAWRYITEESSPRFEIMELAVTVTTMFLEHGESAESRARKLWESRQAACLEKPVDPTDSAQGKLEHTGNG